LGATIGASLECAGAQLANANGDALTAESTNIGDSAFLSGGFNAQGTVNFPGSDISKGFVMLRTASPEKAALDLRYAKVGTLWNDAESWPPAGKIFLDGFTYGRLAKGAPMDAKRRIEWLNRRAGESFLPQPYEQLASVLRMMGHEEEARNVLIKRAGITRVSRALAFFRRNGFGVGLPES
jgi:hypothetical protein